MTCNLQPVAMIRLSLTAGLLCAACLKQDACESEIAVLSPVGQGITGDALLPCRRALRRRDRPPDAQERFRGAWQLQPSPPPEPAELRYRGMRRARCCGTLRKGLRAATKPLAVIEDFVKAATGWEGSPEESHVERLDNWSREQAGHDCQKVPTAINMERHSCSSQMTSQLLHRKT